MDRRNFLLTGSLAAGLGALATDGAARAAAAPSASFRGPYLDLATGKGNMLALVRMHANLDESKVKYGSASGIVSGVRPNEKLRDLFGFEVVSAARAWKQPDGSYRVLHRETILYTDLQTGEIPSEFVNPYTNERVKVVDVVNDPWNEEFEEFAPRPPSYGGLNKDTNVPRKPLQLAWEQSGNGLAAFQRHIHLFYPSALTPDKWPRESSGPMNQVTEVFAYVMTLQDLQDSRKSSLEYGGTWSRVTPWLPWLLMGQAPGHIMYWSTMQGFDDIGRFKPRVLAYMKKTHPQMLEPPPKESWAKPNLSSLEVYARDQKPAPAKKP